jgi:hypothetical protein
MRTECIAAVSEAIGRPIRNKEAAQIERRIKEGMGNRARLDPAAWRARLPMPSLIRRSICAASLLLIGRPMASDTAAIHSVLMGLPHLTQYGNAV